MSDSPSLSTQARREIPAPPWICFGGVGEGGGARHLTVFFHPDWPQIVQCEMHQGELGGERSEANAAS